MARNAVQIDKVHLRIPGLSRVEGRRIGAEVAQRVAQSLPASGRTEHLGVIDMSVNLPLGTSRDQIAKLIALSILEKLG